MLELWQNYKDNNPTVLALSLQNLATVLAAKGSHAEAEALYLKALAMFERETKGKDSRDSDGRNLAICLERLALLYRKMGNESRALKREKRATSVMKSVDLDRLSGHHANWGQVL